LTERLLVEINKRLDREGISFLPVIIPSPVQVFPNADVRKKSMEAFNLQDLEYPEKRLSIYGKNEGIDVLPLKPYLLTIGESENLYLYGFRPNCGGGHLNESGNLIVGKILAEYIHRHYLLKSKGKTSQYPSVHSMYLNT
jgi:hypothetical protein